jgi:hypothetical protein
MATLYSWGWKPYGPKHSENIYTMMVGGFLLPNKFDIDKRKTYLSAQIREGVITKFQAREFLLDTTEFDLELLGKDKARILHLINSRPVGSRDSYKRYNFKKWKVVFWVLYKLKVFPYSAYHKYCK